MGSYTIRPAKNNQAATVEFSGQIDESCDFTSIKLDSFKAVEFDLSGVDRVNSRGIRNWMAWVANLDRSKTYSLKGMPRALATHANVLRDIVPPWMSLTSVEIPYFCEECGTAFKDYLALKGKAIPDNLEESRPCPKCGAAADVDIRPEIYFRFLKPNA